MRKEETKSKILLNMLFEKHDGWGSQPVFKRLPLQNKTGIFWLFLENF